MNDIIAGVLIIGGSGLIIGMLLGLAQKYLVVKDNPNVELIHEMLPHFNCGACGYPGCNGMANGLVSSEVSVDKCRPSKPEQKEAIIAKLEELGIEILK